MTNMSNIISDEGVAAVDLQSKHSSSCIDTSFTTCSPARTVTKRDRKWLVKLIRKCPTTCQLCGQVHDAMIMKNNGSNTSTMNINNSSSREIVDNNGRPCDGDCDEDDSSSILQDKIFALAPMVDQSELPFRLLCRRYGANICFTPMLHARVFVQDINYRTKFFNVINGTPSIDRPLIVQLAGGDADIMLQAAKYVESFCDAIDINCGCPQHIARRGNYGAFLLEDTSGDRLENIVHALSIGLSIPVTVKVRLLPGTNGIRRSIHLYQRIVDAGASMLTIHGRTRLQKSHKTGSADWMAIRKVVQALGHAVPILANGSLSNLEDVKKCLRYTGADGVVSSEAILEYPPFFCPKSVDSKTGERLGPGRLQLGREYMALAQQYPPDDCGQGSKFKCIRMHIHKFFHADLQYDLRLRDLAIAAQNNSDIWNLIETVAALHRELKGDVNDVSTERLSWYMRHRKVDENGVNITLAAVAKSKTIKHAELADDTGVCFATMFAG